MWDGLKVPAEAGVFGGHTEFGTKGRYWDFRSLGRGNINFEEIIRALNRIGYKGPFPLNGKTAEWTGNTEQKRPANLSEILTFLLPILLLMQLLRKNNYEIRNSYNYLNLNSTIYGDNK